MATSDQDQHRPWTKPAARSLLKRQIPRGLTRHLELTGDWAPPEILTFNRRSCVAKITNGDTDFIVKIVSPNSTASAEQQFDALAQMREYDPEQRFLAVPEPLFLMPKRQAVVMEWIAGPTLEAMLLGDEASTEARRDAIAGAIRWIAALHRTQPRQTGTFSSAARLAALHNRFAERAVSAEAERYHGLIQEQCTAFDGTPMPLTVTHGDAIPRNFILSDGRIVGVDFALDTMFDPLSDHARFLIDLELIGTERLGPHSARWGLSQTALEFVREAGRLDEEPMAEARFRLHLMTTALLRLAGQMPHAGAPDKPRQRNRFGDVDETMRRLEGILAAAAAPCGSDSGFPI